MQEGLLPPPLPSPWAPRRGAWRCPEPRERPKTVSKRPKTRPRGDQGRFRRVRETTRTVLRGSTVPEDVANMPRYASEGFQRRPRRSQDPHRHQQNLKNVRFMMVKRTFFIFVLSAFPNVQDASRPPQKPEKRYQGALGGPQIAQERAQEAPKRGSEKIGIAPKGLPARLWAIFPGKDGRR